MIVKLFILFTFLGGFEFTGYSQSNKKLSINGFSHWITGRDSATIQLIPGIGYDPLITEGNSVVARVKFKIVKYGELSFPLNPSFPGTEAPPVDLSKSRFITVEYKANHEVVLQLRQTGVHGGIHNHIILAQSASFIKNTIYLSSFKGGLELLDLSTVAKFNFAFLANNPEDGFAELIVRSFKIDRYSP